MGIEDIGALCGVDETLNHQIVDTFATVSQADLAWTERVWGSLARTDGSLQLEFGLGKYHNRGIADAFAGISRGREQWTVRASRELDAAPEELAVGPVRYEIVQSLRQVRYILEPNTVQPISFDVTLSGVTLPYFEDRNLFRNKRTGRIDVNVVRYHQGGWASGTVSIDGVTHEISPDEWFGYRDHSWGVRQAVGVAPTDLLPAPVGQDGDADSSTRRTRIVWLPMFFRRPDGTYYETAVFTVEDASYAYSSAYINGEDGSQTRVRSIAPNLTYDPNSRYPTGGDLLLTEDSGEKRCINIEVLGTSGYALMTGGYGSFKGHRHGSWRGPLHLDGEYISDVGDDENLRLLGQLRDIPIRAHDGDAVGYGILESVLTGDWSELGVTPESDHHVSNASPIE